jgi:hypothetical protein
VPWTAPPRAPWRAGHEPSRQRAAPIRAGITASSLMSEPSRAAWRPSLDLARYFGWRPGAIEVRRGARRLPVRLAGELDGRAGHDLHGDLLERADPRPRRRRDRSGDHPGPASRPADQLGRGDPCIEVRCARPDQEEQERSSCSCLLGWLHGAVDGSIRHHRLLECGGGEGPTPWQGS